jgi:hypothetical protein
MQSSIVQLHSATRRSRVTFPSGLYVAHINVTEGTTSICHQEHLSITLGKGTYRIRRQRELEPRNVQLVSD